MRAEISRCDQFLSVGAFMLLSFDRLGTQHERNDPFALSLWKGLFKPAIANAVPGAE